MMANRWEVMIKTACPIQICNKFPAHQTYLWIQQVCVYNCPLDVIQICVVFQSLETRNRKSITFYGTVLALGVTINIITDQYHSIPDTDLLSAIRMHEQK